MAPAMADLYANSKYFFYIDNKEWEKLALDQELGLYTYSKIIWECHVNLIILRAIAKS